MIIGKRTPQRIEQYLKYNTSNIFNNKSETQNLPQTETNSSLHSHKKNELSLNEQQFEPKYENLTSLQRYNKHFWNEEPSKNRNHSSKNHHRTFLDLKPPRTKVDNDKAYTSRQRYIKDLFGEEYINENDSNQKKKKNTRSKSLFQKSAFFLDNDDGNGNEDEDQNNVNICQKIKELNYCSDIFHTKTNKYTHKSVNSLPNCNILSKKEEEKYNSIPIDQLLQPNRTKRIVIKPLNLNDIKTKTIIPVYNTDRQDQMKHMFPTGYDWTNSNTELSSKSHIYRSKNNNQEHSIHHKAPSLNYVLSTREVTQDYYSKFPKKEIKENDIQMYEMKGPRRFLENLEDKTVKQLFLEKGIHIYNYENKFVFNDGDSKITFQLRNNEDEKEFQNKLKRIKNEINSFGVDFKRVYVNTSKYPRKRKATPGHVLKQEKKQLKE